MPPEIHLTMSTDEGFHAHVAGDKKNKKLGLKFGARLFKIGDKKVENLTYEEILSQLQKSRPPITLTFKEVTFLFLFLVRNFKNFLDNSDHTKQNCFCFCSCEFVTISLKRVIMYRIVCVVLFLKNPNK